MSMIINNLMSAIHLVQINRGIGEGPQVTEKGPYPGSLEQECQTNSENYIHLNRHADTKAAA